MYVWWVNRGTLPVLYRCLYWNGSFCRKIRERLHKSSMAVCFRLTNIFHQTSFSRIKWRLSRNPLNGWQLWFETTHCKCERQFGFNNVQQQRKTTLPTSRRMVRTVSRAKLFTLITGSKLCHCRLWLFCVCYIISRRQLCLVFAIPGTDSTMDVCIIQNPLSPGVVCPYPGHEDFAGEPFTHSCIVTCWKNCCAQNKQHVFSNGHRSTMSWAA